MGTAGKGARWQQTFKCAYLSVWASGVSTCVKILLNKTRQKMTLTNAERYETATHIAGRCVHCNKSRAKIVRELRNEFEATRKHFCSGSFRLIHKFADEMTRTTTTSAQQSAPIFSAVVMQLMGRGLVRGNVTWFCFGLISWPGFNGRLSGGCQLAPSIRHGNASNSVYLLHFQTSIRTPSQTLRKRERERERERPR